MLFRTSDPLGKTVPRAGILEDLSQMARRVHQPRLLDTTGLNPDLAINRTCQVERRLDRGAK